MQTIRRGWVGDREVGLGEAYVNFMPKSGSEKVCFELPLRAVGINLVTRKFAPIRNVCQSWIMNRLHHEVQGLEALTFR